MNLRGFFATAAGGMLLSVTMMLGTSLNDARADRIPDGWTAENMEVVGYTIMNGHPAFKITMQKTGDRYYLVAGHYNIPGWSVVDVTDPADPKVAKFIPGPDNTSTNQVDLADNILVAALGSSGYLGYPVVRALLGEGAMPAAVFYDVFGTVAVLFTLGIAVAARHGEHEGRLNVLKELFTFPAMIALLVALAYRFVPLPAPVSATVMDWTGVAASMAMPLIMVSLGVSLDMTALRGSFKPLSAAAAIKLLLLPVLAVGVATIMRDRSMLHLLALQAGMPSMMLSLVVGERFKLDTTFIAAAILITTVACLVTIPLVQLLVP